MRVKIYLRLLICNFFIMNTIYSKTITLALTLLVLSGCTIPESKKNEPVISPSTAGSKSEETKTEEAKTGYYVSETGYLMHDSEKLFDEELITVAGQYDKSEEFDVYRVVEQPDQTTIYLTGGAGCGGCVWLSTAYVSIDGVTHEATVKKIADSLNSYVFDRGVVFFNALHSVSDKKIIVFVREAAGPVPESVWKFDLVTQSEQKIATIAKDKSVLKCDTEGMGLCEVDETKMKWKDDNVTISIPHVLATSKEKNEKSYGPEYLIYTRTIRNLSNEAVHPFDFNNDGELEYLVYFEQALLEKDPIYGYTENGAYEIYKWNKNKNEFEVIFADEGTVGKKYGVNRIMKDPGFYREIDLDNDGKKEVEISTTQDGSGGYTDSYILKWNNDQIVKAKIVDTKTLEEIKKTLLKDNEVVGPGSIDYIGICLDQDPGNWNCPFRQGGPGERGMIQRIFTYADGIFTATDYKRISSQEYYKNLNVK